MTGRHDWRPLTEGFGTKTDVKFDTDGKVIIRTVGDEKPVLDHNARLRSQASDDKGYTVGGFMKRVASIPADLIVKWLVEEGLDVFNPEHAGRLARKLNDPDYAYLRTAPGQLGIINGGEGFR